jgi:hypothetical protein
MAQDQLAALEHAAEPYLDSGYSVYSQTDSSLTLMRKRRQFSVIIFLLLLIVFWPAAIIYSAVNRSRRDKVICLRITSQGDIEASGDILKAAESSIGLAGLIIITIVAVGATILFLKLVR